MSDYVAQTEINDVLLGLQSGRYRFLYQKAQQIKFSDGTNLNFNFNNSKYSYISSLRNNQFSHGVIISDFLKWISESRKFGVLVENEKIGPDQFDIATDHIVKSIIGKLHSLNVLSKNLFGYELFFDNPSLTQDLKYPCNMEPEFIFRIGTIASIIDNVNDKVGISAKLRDKPLEGSINLIESFLIENNVDAEPAVKILRNFYRLRSWSSPIQAGDHEAIDILNELDISFPVLDWIDAGEKCFIYFSQSIDLLISSISQHQYDSL